MVPYTFTRTLHSSSVHPTEVLLLAALNPTFELEPSDVFLDQFSLAFAMLVSKQVATPSNDTAAPYIYYGL
jgi:hypothetical protein